MGRPSKLTPGLMESMEEDLLNGHYPETVAKANGISSATYYSWLQKGRDAVPGVEATERYAAFLEMVERSQAKAEIALTTTALAGDMPGESNGVAKAAQWMLERSRGKRFQPRVAVKVEEETSVLLDVAAAVLPPEMYAELLGAMSDTDDQGIPNILSRPLDTSENVGHTEH